MFDSPRATGYDTRSSAKRIGESHVGREMEAAGAPANEPKAETRLGPPPPPARVMRRGARTDQLSPREEELNRARQVVRPVALLALIERLEKWTIDDDLIAAVIEAAEAGIQIDSLYENGAAAAVESAEEKEERAAAKPAGAVPMPVYRVGDGSLIHFNKEGKPVGPPIQYFFTSKFSSESAFGCELAADSMISNAPPCFRRGDVLIFSVEKKVESGDFAFVKTRGGDEFVQVFFHKDETVRLRPLNSKFFERTVRRPEIKAMFKLVGRFQEL